MSEKYIWHSDGVVYRFSRQSAPRMYIVEKLAGITDTEADTICRMLEEAHENGIINQILRFKEIMKIV